MPSDGVFHQHLDQCRQCAEHPFALCPEGARLLPIEAEEAARAMGIPSEIINGNIGRMFRAGTMRDYRDSRMSETDRRRLARDPHTGGTDG